MVDGTHSFTRLSSCFVVMAAFARVSRGFWVTCFVEAMRLAKVVLLTKCSCGGLCQCLVLDTFFIIVCIIGLV